MSTFVLDTPPASPHATRLRLAADSQQLLTYPDPSGATRELIVLPGAEGSKLLIDRFVERGIDPRLVAHLSADEPLTNASLICSEYLADARRGCRRLRDEDLREPPDVVEQWDERWASGIPDPSGGRYLIAAVSGEARWLRGDEPVSVRHVMGTLERYEPVRRITLSAIAVLRGETGVSVAALGAELRRLDNSPIVLNRGLRSAVLEAMRVNGLSLSAIAMRCGRIKADGRGRCSGETSWLARRVGLLPEGGCGAVTPWVHSDVLALIARDGLGLAPQDVEVR